jgi:hypothetical protein
MNNATSEKSLTSHYPESRAWAAHLAAHAFSNDVEGHAFSSRQGTLPLFHGADAEHVALCVLTQRDPAKFSN